MRLFWELAKRAFQLQITYRTATIAGLVTNFFFGLLRAAVLVALYNGQSVVEGVSLAGAITYTGVTQAIIMFLALFGTPELMRRVISGEIGADLLKPMNQFTYWMATDFGRSLSHLILRGIPIMIFYVLVFGVTTPASGGQWLAFWLSLFLGWTVSFAWRFIISLIAFWTLDAVSFGRLAGSLAMFLSGFLMPLRFFPEWFQRLCYLTPFPYMVNVPLEIYLGVRTPDATLSGLFSQALWILLLILLGQVMLRAGVRRLVIQGG